MVEGRECQGQDDVGESNLHIRLHQIRNGRRHNSKRIMQLSSLMIKHIKDTSRNLHGISLRKTPDSNAST